MHSLSTQSTTHGGSSTDFAVQQLSANSLNTAADGAPNYGEYRIIRRNGAVVGFEPSKIAIAMTKAFLAVNGGQGAASAMRGIPKGICCVRDMRNGR